MKTIDIVQLELVTGGSLPLTSIDKPTTGSSSNGDLTAALQGIQSSLKDLGKNQNTLFSGTNGLMFVTMALALSRRNDTVVYAGGGGGWGGGWHHHGFRIW